jgi:hypothetical protein
MGILSIKTPEKSHQVICLNSVFAACYSQNNSTTNKEMEWD